MLHEKLRYFENLEATQEYVNPLSSHPFGLDTTMEEPWRPISIKFVGANAPDMSVEAFLAHVRFWVGYTPGNELKKLRVITMPFPKGSPDQKYVFFEFWASRQIIISGETTNFSGAGNAARQQLEDVFSVLELVHKVSLERVEAKSVVRIPDLYAAEVDA